jgi:hypothetical protein
MSLLTDEVRSLIGRTGTVEAACEPVEAGAVRRYVQAYVDDDPRYRPGAASPTRYGGAVAPPLYPMNMFRRAAGTPDPFAERARDPHFDGIVGSTAQGLPPLPLPPGTGLLNAGTDVEVFRYARLGEAVTAVSRYAEITEKQSTKGPMLLVVIETEYRGDAGDVLLRVRKTQIRR